VDIQKWVSIRKGWYLCSGWYAIDIRPSHTWHLERQSSVLGKFFVGREGEEERESFPYPHTNL
jgi:hypothetical protein